MIPDLLNQLQTCFAVSARCSACRLSISARDSHRISSYYSMHGNKSLTRWSHKDLSRGCSTLEPNFGIANFYRRDRCSKIILHLNFFQHEPNIKKALPSFLD